MITYSGNPKQLGEMTARDSKSRKREEQLMEKKNRHLGRYIVLGLLALLVIVLVVAKCNPSPYGADLKKITTLIFVGVCAAAVGMIVMLVVRARRNHRLLKIAAICKW